MSGLAFALLGLLAEQPLSGYDLAARMKGRVAHFWEARHSQIYPELARLESEGFVEHHVVAQDSRPDKKLYRLTAHGLSSLRAWIAAPPEPLPNRDELVLKAYLCWVAPAAAAAMLRTEAERMEGEAKRFKSLAANLRAQTTRAPAPGDADFGSLATLRLGVSHRTATAEWCRWLASELDGVKKKKRK